MILLVSLMGLIITTILIISMALTSSTEGFMHVVLALNTILISYLLADHIYLWYNALQVVKKLKEKSNENKL